MSFKPLSLEFADNCVSLCIAQYNKLPKSGKPTESEWTVIAGVIEDDSEDLKVISLATGSKCLGRNSLCPLGTVINDAHAEVLARRGLLFYLYKELLTWRRTTISRVFEGFIDGKVKMKDNIRYCFVTSTVPCGDAAIMPVPENCNVAYSSENGERPSKRPRKVTPMVGDIFRTGAKCLPSSDRQDALRGGVEYHVTGVVRTKPGRGDPTCSVSCSDKMARWNAVGAQGALLSLIISSPIRFCCVIIGAGVPFSQDSAERAINDRVGLSGQTAILQSKTAFPCTRSTSRTRPSPASLIWNLHSESVQVCVMGRLSGATSKSNSYKSALNVTKWVLLKLFREVCEECRASLDVTSIDGLCGMNYGQLKKLAVGYHEKWASVVEGHLVSWTEKPPNLEDFAIQA